MLLPPPDNPNTCRLYDCFIDICGDDVVGSKIKATAIKTPLRTADSSYKVLIYEKESKITDPTGFGYIDLIWSSFLQYKRDDVWYDTVTYNIIIKKPDGTEAYKLENYTVPDSVSLQLP